MTTTVYVHLLDEGTDVWRPTAAVRQPDGHYLLLATPDYDPADEKWAFLPGQFVRCELRKLSGGEVLVATSLA